MGDSFCKVLSQILLQGKMYVAINIQLCASKQNDCCFYFTGICFPLLICTPISCRYHNFESLPNEVARATCI